MVQGNKRARYKWLREHHFAPVEAREFCKLKGDYPALRHLIRQRAAQWGAFNRRAVKNNWSEKQRRREWVSYLERFYADRRYKVVRGRRGEPIPELRQWITQKDVHGRPIPPKPSPWEWYDATFQRLPDKDRWDTPRSHRRHTREPVISLDRVTRSRWINEITREINAARARGEDERVAELRAQLARLRSTGIR